MDTAYLSFNHLSYLGIDKDSGNLLGLSRTIHSRDLSYVDNVYSWNGDSL